MKLIFLLLAFVSTAKANTERLNFILSPDGTFHLVMNIPFPGDLIPEKIIQSFTDPKRIIKLSNIIKAIKEESGTQSIFTKSCKSFSCAETKSKCSYTHVSPTEVKYSCWPDLEHEATRKLFYSGETHYACQKNAGINQCSFLFKGRPKPFSFLLFSRTSQQLAIGGAIETAIGIFKLALPMVQDKESWKKILQSVEEKFYLQMTEELKKDPTKILNFQISK